MRISDWSSDVCSSDLHERKGFFGWFNRTFDRNTARYGDSVLRMNKSWKRSMLLYALIVIGMGVVFARLPGGFLPDEDQGILIAQVALPNGAPRSEEHTSELQSLMRISYAGFCLKKKQTAEHATSCGSASNE